MSQFIPLPDLCAAYLLDRKTEKLTEHTTRRITAEVEAIAALVGSRPVAEVTAGDLTPGAVRTAFAAYAGPRSKSTVAGCISTWTVFCKWLIREGYLDANPMLNVERPRLPKPTPKALAGGAPTVHRLLDSVRRGDRPARRPWPERDLAVLAVLAAGGLRRGEVAGLNVVDLDLGDVGAQFRVTGKGGVQRWVPVGPEVPAVINAYLMTRAARFPPKTRSGLHPADAPLLVNDVGSRCTGRQLWWIVQQCYRAAGVAAQVPRGAMVHALRHTYATMLAEQGAAATDIQRLLGHGSLATSQLYVSVSDDRLRAVAYRSPALAALRVAQQPEEPTPRAQ